METIHLIGAEDVRTASSRMTAAAEDMRSAAATIDSAMERAAIRLENAAVAIGDGAIRIETALDQHAQRMTDIAGLMTPEVDKVRAGRIARLLEILDRNLAAGQPVNLIVNELTMIGFYRAPVP